jgi:hypothetical protein
MIGDGNQHYWSNKNKYLEELIKEEPNYSSQYQEYMKTQWDKYVKDSKDEEPLEDFLNFSVLEVGQVILFEPPHSQSSKYLATIIAVSNTAIALALTNSEPCIWTKEELQDRGVKITGLTPQEVIRWKNELGNG